ncbi:MAG TPA: ROK family protein [Candidatus Limnocylindria bacterium]|nr:ROK family protein [Candidatus Limnocylindria bacterium]
MSVPGDLVGQRSETVRRSNLSAIVRELHVRGPLSRSDLVGLTGLTRSAIRGLIGELVAGGLVTEVPNQPAGTPGRPSPIVQPNARGAVAVALEVNVDSLAAALVGFGGTLHQLARVDRPRGHLSVDAIVDDLVELVGPLLRAVDPDALVGIGVAVAGIVRRSDGIVRMAPNLGWRDVPLAQRLREALPVVAPVWVANEADLGGLAEHRRGAAIGADEVLYVMGEVGVGGNMIVDGRPIIGIDGYAGEIGHMSVNPDGLACACGSRGCWETEIGERALLTRAGFDPEGGREAIGEVIAAATAGEPRAVTAVEEVGRWLGIGISSLVNVLNPQLVVVGGVLERLYPLMARTLEEAVAVYALPPGREHLRIVPGALGDDAPTLGAAELAFEPLLADAALQLRLRSPAALVSA